MARDSQQANGSDLGRELAEIRQRTRDWPELTSAHHFVFDLPLFAPHERSDFVVLGENPGESPSDWMICGPMAEESSSVNFRMGERLSKSAKVWRKKAQRILRTEKISLTEMYFWSSENSGKAFKSRFGSSFDSSPHLAFCRDANLEMFKVRQPKAVVATGLGQLRNLLSLYGLRRSGAALNDGANRLVIELTDGERLWFLTRHWSAFGFSRRQQDAIGDFIACRTDSATMA